MRDVSIPNWLKELPLAPVFYPTDTEFADPIAYISKIEKQATAFGICKVIPPLPKPSKKYVVNNLNKSLLKSPELGRNVRVSNVGEVNRAVFTTRHQELGCDKAKEVSKQVWQIGEICTLEQFELKSKVFAKSQLGVVKDVVPLDVESRFWKAASERPIYIEYANDVPGLGFGELVGASRFMRKCRRRRRNFNRYGNDSDERKGESVNCSDRSEVDVSKKDTSLVDDGLELRLKGLPDGSFLTVLGIYKLLLDHLVLLRVLCRMIFRVLLLPWYILACCSAGLRGMLKIMSFIV